MQERERCKSSCYGWMKMNDMAVRIQLYFKKSESKIWQKDWKIRSKTFFDGVEDFMKTLLYYVFFLISYKIATPYGHEASQLV